MTKPKTVTDYFNQAPPKARKKLREIRAYIRSVAPKATESLKWGMPTFSNKRILVIYAAFKNHIGFFPTPSAVKAFAKKLSKYKTGKGSIQFPLDRPLPKSLIRQIAKFRVQESSKQDKKWKT